MRKTATKQGVLIELEKIFAELGEAEEAVARMMEALEEGAEGLSDELINKLRQANHSTRGHMRALNIICDRLQNGEVDFEN